MKVEFPMADVLSLSIVDGNLTIRLRSAPEPGGEDWKDRVRRELRELMRIHEITCEKRGSRILLSPDGWTQDVLATRLGTRQPVISELLNEMTS